jgi:hypothetical protein
MFLVRGLLGDAQRLRNLCPCPAICYGLPDRLALELIGHRAQGYNCGQRIGWFFGEYKCVEIRHASTLVDACGIVNQS